MRWIPLLLITLVTTSLHAAKCGTPLQFKPKQFEASTSTPLTAEIKKLNREVLVEVNKFRRKYGKPPLQNVPLMSEQAQNHSNSMAAGTTPFSHDGVMDRIMTIKAAISSLRNFGENCFYCTKGGFFGTLAQYAVYGWSRSSGHRSNMLGKFNLSGIGVAYNDKGQYYFTQIFLKAEWNQKNQ